MAKHVVHAQRERVFFAEVASVLIDNRQPVGIRILTKADIGSELSYVREHACQILCGRLWLVRKAPVRLISQLNNLAAEPL